jgi:hypothetical protein
VLEQIVLLQSFLLFLAFVVFDLGVDLLGGFVLRRLPVLVVDLPAEEADGAGLALKLRVHVVHEVLFVLEGEGLGLRSTSCRWELVWVVLLLFLVASVCRHFCFSLPGLAQLLLGELRHFAFLLLEVMHRGGFLDGLFIRDGLVVGVCFLEHLLELDDARNQSPVFFVLGLAHLPFFLEGPIQLLHVSLLILLALEKQRDFSLHLPQLACYLPRALVGRTTGATREARRPFASLKGHVLRLEDLSFTF